MLHNSLLPPPRTFFLEDARTLAQKLIGSYLVHEEAHVCTGGKIVETEAYLSDDPASHSYKGWSKRNTSMFLEGGHAYVYTIYGIHACMNVVSSERGRGEAVLIRALEPVFGIAEMGKRRRGNRNITNGPARLAQALGITPSFHDGISLHASQLRIYLPPFLDVQVITALQATKRIRTTRNPFPYWRYILSTSAHISR